MKMKERKGIKYSTVSVPVEVKKILEETKGEEEW
jgi:hypothetical protein